MGRIFLSTLSLRRATQRFKTQMREFLFLSTLSLRRATVNGDVLSSCFGNFYPRSPCGERPANAVDQILPGHISIHALLAESDRPQPPKARVLKQFLSTLSLRRATTWTVRQWTSPDDFYPRSPCGERLLADLQIRVALDISIHALLAESDSVWGFSDVHPSISIHALLAESDLNAHLYYHSRGLFLSTLSLRRATNANLRRHCSNNDFYPRSPCGERRRRGVSGYLDNIISIHALLAESDAPYKLCLSRNGISIHALLAESDTVTARIIDPTFGFLSTLSLRRATAILDFFLQSNIIFLSTLSLRRATG